MLRERGEVQRRLGRKHVVLSSDIDSVKKFVREWRFFSEIEAAYSRVGGRSWVYRIGDGIAGMQKYEEEAGEKAGLHHMGLGDFIETAKTTMSEEMQKRIVKLAIDGDGESKLPLLNMIRYNENLTEGAVAGIQEGYRNGALNFSSFTDAIRINPRLTQMYIEVHRE